MKLRNKKTGESINFDILPEEVKRAIEVGVTYFWYNYELYQPKEPLIKDEKIRKAVRAWADANDIERVWHECSSCWLRGNGLTIELENEVVDLTQDNYSIAELCGEEEE